MNKVGTIEPSARAELFAETAGRMGVADAIVEKDFWICWTLKQLFSNKAFEGRLLFKGGTSLSKIYHAIRCPWFHGREGPPPGEYFEDEA